MWHSTQFTRACAPSLWAAISSGCTSWHIVAQNALLLLYSQPAMPAALSRATVDTATAIVPTVPSTRFQLPIRNFMLSRSSYFSRARFCSKNYGQTARAEAS